MQPNGRTDRQTDTTKLIVTFYNFDNLPKTADIVNSISWKKHVVTHTYALYLNSVFNRSMALTTVKRFRRNGNSNNRDSEIRHCTVRLYRSNYQLWAENSLKQWAKFLKSFGILLKPTQLFNSFGITMKRPNLHLRMSESDKRCSPNTIRVLSIFWWRISGFNFRPKRRLSCLWFGTSRLTGHDDSSSSFTIHKLVIPL
jgi:hypothetical protein